MAESNRSDRGPISSEMGRIAARLRALWRRLWGKTTMPEIQAAHDAGWAMGAYGWHRWSVPVSVFIALLLDGIVVGFATGFAIIGPLSFYANHRRNVEMDLLIRLELQGRADR